ncbi:hypothetical protein OG884_20740 [Streptosporangium sp. NBC_01755]|nr:MULTISPECIES: hypothetical protein [unclassified Streptosporangium]WSA24600.1 hypothetical protein OIE13_27180 [Streptosporangium sp. NBC_01810]WSC97325.1 hypothetical protein OG884_20740 [Streptosporangium sp. NBC_01755]
MTPQLDPVIHAPTRLQIVSLLAAAEEAEFAFVRDSLDISDSVPGPPGRARARSSGPPSGACCLPSVRAWCRSGRWTPS